MLRRRFMRARAALRPPSTVFTLIRRRDKYVDVCANEQKVCSPGVGDAEHRRRRDRSLCRGICLHTYIVVIYATITTFFTSTNAHTKAVLLRALGVHTRVRHAVWRPVSALPLYSRGNPTEGKQKSLSSSCLCSAAVVVHSIYLCRLPMLVA